jgi:hypothetical protein
MSPKAPNMKTGVDTLGTAENEYGSAKHENGNRRPRYPENVFGRGKHENGTRRPRNRRKRVRGQKIIKRNPTLLIPPKTSPGTQNEKTGSDTLGSAENESGRAKQENGT